MPTGDTITSLAMKHSFQVGHSKCSWRYVQRYEYHCGLESETVNSGRNVSMSQKLFLTLSSTVDNVDSSASPVVFHVGTWRRILAK